MATTKTTDVEAEATVASAADATTSKNSKNSKSKSRSESETRSRSRRIGRQLTRVLLGLVCGAAIAECAFRTRDDGAFPHLNIYDPDPKLGVQLRPGATQRVAFGGNAPTSVRIGAEGLRGDVPAAPVVSDGDGTSTSNAILIVGDSQVFGLGVEENETFSARLAAKQKRPVINAGIPTYGPLEYQAVLDAWVPKHKPRTVVYVINLANDLVEARRPNILRHVVWDGWAVRKETAPASVTWFPGRALLFRESHAIFALRRLLHGRSAADEQPLPSEGTSRDLLDAANASNQAHQSADQQALDDWLTAMKEASQEATDTQKKLQKTAESAYPDVFDDQAGKAYLKTNGQPGDIVSEAIYSSEAATRPDIRVRTVLKGAEIRAQIETNLKRRAEAEIEKQEAKAILASFEDRAKIEKRIAELRTLPAKLARAHSPMAGPLDLVHSLCKANRARLVVVALPMDVQVSMEEWKKYGVESLDMTPSKILIDDIVYAASSISVSVLDATNALAAAEPGAFLKADLHMSVKGHQALADAIDAKINEPAPNPTITTTANAAVATPSAGPAIGYNKVCNCQKTIHPAIGCASLEPRPDVDCLRSYSDHCDKLLACLQGAATAQPKCLDGWTNSGERHRCFKSCVVLPCGAGTTCTKTKEGQVCL